jgi:hypothetical protein
MITYAMMNWLPSATHILSQLIIDAVLTTVIDVG